MVDLNKKHVGKLIDAFVKEVGEKKTPVLVLLFEVTHARNESDDGWAQINPENAEVNLFLSGQGMERSITQLKDLGFNGNFSQPAFDPAVSEKGTVIVPFNNKKGYLNWRLYSETSISKATQNTLDVLNAKFKDAFAEGADESEVLPY